MKRTYYNTLSKVAHDVREDNGVVTSVCGNAYRGTRGVVLVHGVSFDCFDEDVCCERCMEALVATAG